MKHGQCARCVELAAEVAALRHAQCALTEAQIKYMVDRFLGWRLPQNFNPDAGISYTRPNYMPSVDATPSGTNLFDAAQADAMVRYMIDGLTTLTSTERCDGADDLEHLDGMLDDRERG